MTKPVEYYLDLDLDKSATLLPEEREQRIRSEVFADLINAIYFKSKNTEIDCLMVLRVLGEPDNKTALSDHETWDYEWVGLNEGVEFRSKTVFLIVKGIVGGLSKNG